MTTFAPATTTCRLDISAQATAPGVGRIRRRLHLWLGQVFVDDVDAVDDLTLAASEALENAVDHAFVDAAEAGTMRLRAVDHGDRVSIVISDDGRWQPVTAAGYRGRGIDLMHRLADVSRIRSTDGGTEVTLLHRRVH